MGFLVFVALLGVMHLLGSTLIFVQTITLGVLRIPLVALMAVVGSAYGVVTGHSLAVLGSIFLIVVVLLPRCTGRRGLPLALDVWRLVPVASFALSNLASQLLRALSWLLLPLVVISLVGSEEAGFFYIGWAVAGIGLGTARQLAVSLFAEGSHETQGFSTKARGALLIGVALGGLFAVGTFFLGDLVLRLFGGEYVQRSSGVLKLLAAASPLAAVTSIYMIGFGVSCHCRRNDHVVRSIQRGQRNLPLDFSSSGYFDATIEDGRGTAVLLNQ